ncbi:MAG: MoxR family ATPase, partial [Actinomycetota bacterium]|nr:MoxR family ATPase [Actinomycetota bacterium]
MADEGLATSIFLALVLRRPLLLEGEAGVGKTEVAKVLSAWTGGRLLRLQCYEGIDIAQAVYEWDYARQLLHLRAASVVAESGSSAGVPDVENELYTERFLIRRAILAAIDHGDGPPPVLLIDEVDRADDEFEAFLLEVLSTYQVTIPELGTVRAATPPIVVLTSNRTRELHDALKRRCLYHWIDYPNPERERAIVHARLPELPQRIAARVVEAVGRLREQGDLYKLPGVGETLVWARALVALGNEAELDETLGAALKVHEDVVRVRERGVL